MRRLPTDDGLTARERYELSAKGKRQRAKWRKKRSSKAKVRANSARYRARLRSSKP